MSACCLTVWAKSITGRSVLRIRPEGEAMWKAWKVGLLPRGRRSKSHPCHKRTKRRFPFGCAQGRLLTALRFAPDDGKDGAPSYRRQGQGFPVGEENKDCGDNEALVAWE